MARTTQWRMTMPYVNLLVLALGLAADPLGEAVDALKNNRPKEAVTLARKAIQADPANPRAHMVCGLGLEALQQHREASAAFTRAIELDPKFAAAYEHLGSERLKL